ncbi:armadillo-like helical domain containing protein 1 isoform X1 [Triplophysa dalaica]|uniref:armadillo-like helical domain containing protein 1 isoform X1 n=2 Tax=Triplophysa dalaica TaxID=1582913 RepID=UPI0024DFE263|nr:armadillo-like helical domain containing protein 1 isoform X1 [Triplophysa dalaica]
MNFSVLFSEVSVSVMFSSKEKAAVSQVMCFLREWDQGNKAVRARMLSDFLTENIGKNFYELELEFAQVASLFLARLTAWMRLTYMFGTCLNLQLRALGVFLSASSTHQYLMEFLEMGGVLTLLEILGQENLKDEDKTEALRLLQIIADAGPKYKELICESYGVKAVAECLAKSQEEGTQETAATLLESLAHGNYQNQVYKGLIALMTCTSPRAQKLVLQTLRVVQPVVKTALHDIVEPLLFLLRSPHLEVQYEATELIKELMRYDMKSTLLRGLVALLKPSKQGISKHEIQKDPGMEKMSHPVFLQQAAAARTIRILTQNSEEISRDLLSLGVIHHLLYAMGNQEHPDAQRKASLALEHFVRMYPVVEEHVRRAMGTTLFQSFMNNAECLHLNMDETQANILLSNTNVSCVLEEQNSEP